MVGPSWIHPILVRDDFLKLGAYLVSTLPGLYVQYFPHFYVTGYAVVDSKVSECGKSRTASIPVICV